MGCNVPSSRNISGRRPDLARVWTIDVPTSHYPNRVFNSSLPRPGEGMYCFIAGGKREEKLSVCSEVVGGE